jgi:hypothetical protein
LDVVDGAVTSLQAVFETLSLLDSLTNTLDSSLNVTETVTLADIQTIAGSIYFVRILETILATDSVFGTLLWNLIDDSETASWQVINDPESASWTTMNTAQTPDWTPINDPQTPGWSEVADAETPGWTEITTV